MMNSLAVTTVVTKVAHAFVNVTVDMDGDSDEDSGGDVTVIMTVESYGDSFK